VSGLRDDFYKFFYPQNVAVIGVSPEPNNLGKSIVENLLTFRFPGEILSIGRKPGVVFGQRIYQSLDQIDHPIALAVILTPAGTIPDILEQCGRKGITRVVIESGGFSEMGADGVPLEQTCLRVARQEGIRFVGPNGIGITNMENGLVLPFMPMRRDMSRGPVSILAQSGGVGLSYLGFLAEENIGLNKFVSMGNKSDVDENELLAYLIEDEGTEVILVHLEGFTDGRKFIETAARSRKPVLVHKSNRFKASAQIAHSHTAALFADDVLVDSALEQAGCVRVNAMGDAIDHVKSLTLPPLKGKRLAVVSRSGGHAVIAADACGHYAFELPPFPKEFLEGIESRFRANVIRLQNPLDLGDLFDLVFYENIVEEMLKRDDVHGVLLCHGYRRGYEEEDSRKLVKKVAGLVEAYQKPVAVVILAEAIEIDYLKRHTRIPIFTAPENAMRAFQLSYTWATRERSALEAAPLEAVDSVAAGHLLQAPGAGENLLLSESLELIRAYGLPTAPYRLARSAEEAVRGWESFGRPVAMKVNRPHVSHKTDKGAVRLGLESGSAVREAFERLRKGASAGVFEVLIQEMAPEGHEVIIGGRQDDVFGPVVLFGLGGIYVEALGDVVWRVAPIQAHDARAMLRRIKGRKILTGLRGESPYDLEAVESALIRLSRLISDFPVIQELDVNPIKLGPPGRGTSALDARVIRRVKV